ncbi:MAG: hypothetical protein K0Q59_1023, partial [Paenibacillus sp.]|nr:hypothetical protein [Paenibacillus sp.]
MWKSKTGSVSIALVLLIAPLFMFHAALIDAARVKMAERESENASKAAIRSVLSGYDAQLRSYGLFALGYDTAQSGKLFADVYNANLSADSGSTFRLVAPVPASQSVKTLYTLGNRFVFKRQMLEEMKYRAPVEYALGVTDKLQKSNLTSLMKGASQFAKRAEEIDKLIGKRDDELDEAWKLTQQMMNKATSYTADIGAKLARLNSLHQSIGVPTTKEQAEQQLSMIAEFTVQLGTLQLEATQGKTTMTMLTASITEHLDKAKSYEEQIRSEMSAMQAELASEGAISGTTMPDSYYIKFKTGVGGVNALFNGFEAMLDATTFPAGDNRFDQARYNELAASNNAYGQNAATFEAEQRAEEQQRTGKKDNVNKQKKQQEQKLTDLLERLRVIESACTNTPQTPYKQLETGDASAGIVPFVRKYADYNRVGLDVSSDTFELNDAKQAVKQTTGLIDRLLSALGSIGGQFRDELYMNEFALTKFNYRTYGKEIGKDGSPIADDVLSSRASHVLQGQEAEYLLYGLDSCVQNQTAAYSEMFGLRLIVRTTEALLSPEAKAASLGNPLLMVLWSVTEGAVKAAADMTKLVDGEEVVVTAKGPATLTMNYKDYLRLMMLLHTKEASMIARMQSLIELNTSRDLTGAVVMLQASTEAKLRLWFMPYTVSLFGYPIDGREANIWKTVSLSY